MMAFSPSPSAIVAISSHQPAAKPKKIFSRNDFNSRLALMRAAARREASDEMPGMHADETPRLFGTEVHATPALHWLSLQKRYDYLDEQHGTRADGPRSRLPPLRAPPPAATPPRRWAAAPPPRHVEPRQRIRQPLVDEGGAAATCPICFLEMCLPCEEEEEEEEALARRCLPRTSSGCAEPPEPPASPVLLWTQCCGRAFHSGCVRTLSRCPMCRSWPLRALEE